jgi:hypothetical protein
VKVAVPRMLAGVVLMVLCLGLAACSSAPVKPSAVVGAWYGKDGDSLVFKADGTFSYKNAPLQEEDPDAFTERQTGVGTWSLEPPNSYQSQRIDANYLTNRFDGEIYFETTNGVLQLYVFVGEFSDTSYWFEKCARKGYTICGGRWPCPADS